MNCILCEKELKGKAVIGHHQSYKPNEIIIYLCFNCHKFVHLFPFFNKKQIEKVNQWSLQYSDQWKDGKNNYDKSNYKKNRIAKYSKKYRDIPENKKKAKEKMREWQINNKDKCNEHTKKWQAKNRDKVNKNNRRWIEKNPNYKKEKRTKNKLIRELL